MTVKKELDAKLDVRLTEFQIPGLRKAQSPTIVILKKTEWNQ